MHCVHGLCKMQLPCLTIHSDIQIYLTFMLIVCVCALTRNILLTENAIEIAFAIVTRAASIFIHLKKPN